MREFLKNTKGNAAIMFAAAAVPLLLGAGVAIDMVRANHVQSVLQGATDAAALAGASARNKTPDEIRQIVEDYARSNGVQNVLDYVAEITPNRDEDTKTFSVTIKGRMDTSLMRLANISDMELSAYSEVKLGGSALELVLVLDSTQSMASEGRMNALKDAAEEMVRNVMDFADDGADVKIGIVPFSTYVNVGLSNRNQSWLDVRDDWSEPACWDTYPNLKESNCRMETRTGMNDGVPWSREERVCDINYGTAVKACGDFTHTWRGCVGSRDNPEDEVISGSLRYKGLMDAYCASPITELTDDESDLRHAVRNLSTSGNTYIPAGLIWGWNMITPSQPLGGAKTNAEMQALGGKKVIVLMTDGANTLSPTYPTHDGSDAAQADDKTRRICNNIKDDNVTIFTVAFMVESVSARGVLTDCASEPAKAYDADSAVELSKAFDEITTALAALRLSK